MVNWPTKQILDPIASTTEIFGGDVMNWILQYHNEVDLAAGDPLGIAKIATETRFHSSKLKLYDSNRSNTITFIASDYTEEKEVKFPTTLQTTDEFVFANSVGEIKNKLISGNLNTISNIPDSAFGQITNKGKLPTTIAYKDEPTWLTDFMVAPHASTKISILTKNLLNTQIMYRDANNDIGDHFLELGDMISPGAPATGKARIFYNQTGSTICAIKPSGQVVNLEEAVDITHAAFVPMTKGGIAQFTGDSVTKTFTWAHELTTNVDLVSVKEASPDACGSFYVTHDSSTITVTYQIPPPAGAPFNVKLQWGAMTGSHAASSFAAGHVDAFSGNGTNKVFQMAHNLTGTVPEVYFVNAGSADALGEKIITANATHVICTFATAPPTGTNNVVLVWGAGFVNQGWEGEAIGAMAAGGPATKSGDGSTFVFTIPHNLLTPPDSYYVNAASVDARGSFIVTRDNTNLIITYPEPPPLGSGNLSYVWGATFVGGYADDAFTPVTADTFLNKTFGDWLTITEQSSTPPNPPANAARIYIKRIDADNQAAFILLEVAGIMQEIQIAP